MIAIPPPERLGRYEIRSKLGCGMMGIVYKAWDPLLDRFVALKVLRLDLALSAHERQVLEQRFLREASLAARLSHPRIVVVHDVGRDAETNTPFMALEYLEGKTLAELGPTFTDWRGALRLVARLAEALHHAHGQGVIHRDIKPSNVMLLPSGEPKILDFGIARAATGHFTVAGQTWGTPSYMSPEQASARVVDGRSDLFSLGSVLYKLLTGIGAFSADGIAAAIARVIRDEPPPPTTLNPALPKGLDTIVARALAKDPAHRYPDGRSFAEDAEDVLQGRPVRERPGLRGSTSLEEREAASRTSTLRILGFRPGERRAVRRVAKIGVPGFALAGTLGAAFLFLLPPRPAGDTTLQAAAPPLAVVQAPAPPATAAAIPLPTTPRLAELTPLPSAAPAIAPRPPARVALSVEHAFQHGQLRIWIDDKLVLERPLASIPTRVLFLKKRKGGFAEILEIPAGARRLRFEVSADGTERKAEFNGVFLSNETRLLKLKLGSQVQLDWSS